jgi:hypothetical protein
MLPGGDATNAREIFKTASKLRHLMKNGMPKMFNRKKQYAQNPAHR